MKKVVVLALAGLFFFALPTIAATKSSATDLAKCNADNKASIDNATTVYNTAVKLANDNYITRVATINSDYDNSIASATDQYNANLNLIVQTYNDAVSKAGSDYDTTVKLANDNYDASGDQIATDYNNAVIEANKITDKKKKAAALKTATSNQTAALKVASNVKAVAIKTAGKNKTTALNTTSNSKKLATKQAITAKTATINAAKIKKTADAKTALAQKNLALKVASADLTKAKSDAKATLAVCKATPSIIAVIPPSNNPVTSTIPILTCDSGFHLQNNLCLLDVTTTPTSTAPITNSTTTATTTVSTTPSLATCSAGYYLSNGSCVATTQVGDTDCSVVLDGIRYTLSPCSFETSFTNGSGDQPFNFSILASDKSASYSYGLINPPVGLPENSIYRSEFGDNSVEQKISSKLNDSILNSDSGSAKIYQGYLPVYIDSDLNDSSSTSDYSSTKILKLNFKVTVNP